MRLCHAENPGHTRVALNVQHCKGFNTVKIVTENGIPKSTLLLFTRVSITEAAEMRTVMRRMAIVLSVVTTVLKTQ